MKQKKKNTKSNENGKKLPIQRVTMVAPDSIKKSTTIGQNSNKPEQKITAASLNASLKLTPNRYAKDHQKPTENMEISSEVKNNRHLIVQFL